MPQIMSCIMRDPIGAENTSLISKSLNDIYVKATDTMNKLLETTKVYKRDEIKDVLMPCYYGSKAKPIEAFGLNTLEYDAFMKAKAQVCPGAEYLMPILKNSWNAFADEHYWNLPDGFEAKVKVTQILEKNIEVDELNHLRFNYQYEEIQGTEKGVANIAK